MKTVTETQELARRFNEDEAVWRRYEQKRKQRRLRPSPTPLPKDASDDLDWQTAERERRQTRAVGFFYENR